jgi:ParB family chromosome partitioning protein
VPKRKREEFLAVLEKEGIEILSVYKEPFSNQEQILALVPIRLCQPTPFQREVSPAHLTRLKYSIEKIGRFLDPIILVRSKEGKYWTPNGSHRLAAMKALGKEKITAIIVPDEKVLGQILALNIEKPHNIKEKSLEVIKMYRHFLATGGDIPESEFAFQFEEPYFATLGVIYEKRERFSGAAYVPLLKRIDQFLSQPLSEAIKERERRAKRIEEEVEPKVLRLMKELEEKRFTFPFLKQLIISQNNPVRGRKKERLEFDEGIEQFMNNLARFDPAKMRRAKIPEEFSAE